MRAWHEAPRPANFVGWYYRESGIGGIFCIKQRYRSAIVVAGEPASRRRDVGEKSREAGSSIACISFRRRAGSETVERAGGIIKRPPRRLTSSISIDVIGRPPSPTRRAASISALARNRARLEMRRATPMRAPAAARERKIVEIIIGNGGVHLSRGEARHHARRYCRCCRSLGDGRSAVALSAVASAARRAPSPLGGRSRGARRSLRPMRLRGDSAPEFHSPPARPAGCASAAALPRPARGAYIVPAQVMPMALLAVVPVALHRACERGSLSSKLACVDATLRLGPACRRRASCGGGAEIMARAECASSSGGLRISEIGAAHQY